MLYNETKKHTLIGVFLYNNINLYKCPLTHFFVVIDKNIKKNIIKSDMIKK